MRLALLLAALSVGLAARPAAAAYIFLAEDGKGAIISLEGKIGEGDAAKIDRFMRGAGPFITTLRLRSPGGRAAEAMKIGALVRRYLLATEAPVDEGGVPSCEDQAKECVCASACVFVWVAGAHRNARAFLEAHRPGQPDGSEPDDPAESEAALREYFERLGTPPELADFVLSVPPSRLEPIPAELVRKASGYAPAVAAAVGRFCAPGDDRCDQRVLHQMRRLVHDQQREAAEPEGKPQTPE